ncbi:TonB-dependent siderophore receptor [Brucellaceae bacterium C25G]
MHTSSYAARGNHKTTPIACKKTLKPFITLFLLGASTTLTPVAVQAQQTDEINLKTITVEADASADKEGIVAKKNTTATKTGKDIVKTPQAINVVDRAEMEQRGAMTVTEALRYTPGVVAEGRPSTRYDIGFIRGFGGLQNWFDFVDGMKMQRGLSYNAPAMDAWNIERAEVLKGPASVLYGQIMPGGLVNQVTKKPLDVTQNEVQVTAGNPDRIEAAFDFTGPVKGIDNLKYRLVGLGRYQESNIQFAKTERWFIAPSLTWDVSDKTSLNVYAGYLRDPHSVYPLYLPSTGTVEPNGSLPYIPYDFNAEGKGYSKFDRKQVWAGYEFNHEFNENISFTQKLRFMNTKTDFNGLAIAGIVGSNIYRLPSTVKDDASQVTMDNQLKYNFSTGSLDHTLLTGTDFQYLDATRYLGQNSTPSPIDYLNPNNTAPAVPAYTGYHTLKRTQWGIYAQDQIEVERFAFTAGGRYDRVSYDLDAYSYNASTGIKTPAAIGSVDEAVDHFSWNIGGAYVFDNGIAPYASFSTSFEVPTGTGVGGKAFDPVTARQFEVGMRYQPTMFNGMFTASYFDIEQKNVLTTTNIPGLSNGCSASYCQSQLGKVHSRGLELEAKTELADGFDLIASYTYTHARVTEDTLAFLIGTKPSGVPTHQAGIWGHYRFNENTALAGLGIGAGIRYMGQSEALYLKSANNPIILKVPSYTLVDAAISYDFGVSNPSLEGLKLNISASNLFDKHYVASCSNTQTAVGTCYYGTGREVKATMSYKW